MRLSRVDHEDPTGQKRRHFEISIDSPFHILSCQATQTNTALPAYSGHDSLRPGQLYQCGCPDSTARSTNSSPVSSTGSIPTLQTLGNNHSEIPPSALSSEVSNALPALARPPQAHLSTNAASGVQRPIHMLRSPSFNPPAFEDEAPPPALETPPPIYDDVFGTPSHDGLADYFTR